MKNKIISLMMTLAIVLGIVIPSYAEIDSDTLDYDVNVYFCEDNETDSVEITPYINKQKEYKDGIFGGAPIGSKDFTFTTDSGDNKLNVYFENRSHVQVALTLFEKSGLWGDWVEVNSISISGNDADYFQVTPDHNVRYRVEVSNSTGDKILGILRVRSFRG